MQYITGDELVYLSILHNNKLAGFIILCQEGDETVEFRRIVISSKNRGIGQQTILAMEQYCSQELGCSAIWLDVFESNERGRHIYAKLGYREFKSGAHQGKPLLFMKKQIST